MMQITGPRCSEKYHGEGHRERLLKINSIGISVCGRF
jgi:hypothetical protein